jgi:hypothetical protein
MISKGVRPRRLNPIRLRSLVDFFVDLSSTWRDDGGGYGLAPAYRDTV